MSNESQSMDLSIINSLSPVQKFSKKEERYLLFSLSACVNAPVALRLWRDQGNDGKLMVTLMPADPEQNSGNGAAGTGD